MSKLTRWPPVHGMAVHLAGKLYVDMAAHSTEKQLQEIRAVAFDTLQKQS